VLALAACLVFMRALGHGYVWDDTTVQTRQVAHMDTVGKILFPPPHLPQIAHRYYRPVVFASFRADTWLADTVSSPDSRDGTTTFVLHASVVLWHAVTTVLVFVFARELLHAAEERIRKSVPWVAGLLFAVHPVHVESVAWIAGRTDVICAAFVLASATAYLRARRIGNAIALASSAVLAFLGMLSKEPAIALLPLLPLLDLAAGREAGSPSGPVWQRRRWIGWAAVATAAVAYFLLRYAALPRVDSEAALQIPAGAWTNAVAAFGWYVKKAVWPFPQQLFLDEFVGTAYVFVGCLAAGACVFLAARAIRRRRAGAWTVAAGLFSLTIAPSLLVVLTGYGETDVTERYLYLPSAGAAVLLAGALVTVAGRFSHRHALPALALAVAVPWAIATHVAAGVWESDATFWPAAVKDAPAHPVPHLWLGNVLLGQGDGEGALREYRFALERYPGPQGRARALHNIAVVHFKRRDYATAAEHYEAAT